MKSYPPKVSIINLGCARNLVDSQVISGRLKNKGFALAQQGASNVIINTCCFIEESRQESIDAILDVLELKRRGKVKRVILAGCMAQRYRRDLIQELPGIDALVGVPLFPKDRLPKQVMLTPPHYAYVKVCEGCYNVCSYCVIPKIKGPLQSRRIETVISEIKALGQRGVKELNLIGQDITAYGTDLYHRKSLPELLRAIIRNTRGDQWIRLLYMFPSHVTDELLDLIAAEEKICKYVDIPLQHISDRILKDMNRKMKAAGIKELIARIRRKIPGVALRTSFIVGFPGETERDFKELLAFIRDVRFEKLGAFMYSREEKTRAYNMTPQVPAKVKKRRYDILMSEQRSISGEIHEGYIGQRLKVLIDEKAKEQENVYLGRTQFDAPEVDGLVYVRSGTSLKPGDFADVLITGSSEYDLSGETR